MTKKFTEEQYQKIVQLQKDDFEPTILSIARTNNENFWGNLGLFREDIRDFVFDNDLYEELAAIANPLTREWAHDKFVEKVPVYHFILKDVEDSKGITYHLVRNGRGAIILYPWSEEDSDKPVFKKSDVIIWGFNPEAFEKEEA